MRLFIPALFTGLLVAGCHPSSEDANALVLRTYDLPKGTARSIVSTLDATFWMGGQKTRAGRVAITPDGRLLVLAHPNVQAGVQTLVDEVTKHPPTYDQTIELHYFLIHGKPASSPQPSPAGVSEIQPALDEIVKSQG